MCQGRRWISASRASEVSERISIANVPWRLKSGASTCRIYSRHVCAASLNIHSLWMAGRTPRIARPPQDTYYRACDGRQVSHGVAETLQFRWQASPQFDHVQLLQLNHRLIGFYGWQASANFRWPRSRPHVEQTSNILKFFNRFVTCARAPAAESWLGRSARS